MVTDESVGDVTEFRSLLRQGMGAVGGAEGGAGEATHHSKDPGPDAPARELDGGSSPRAVVPDTKTTSRRASTPHIAFVEPSG